MTNSHPILHQDLTLIHVLTHSMRVYIPLKDVHHAEPRLVLAHLELRSIPVRILTTMSSDVKCRVQWGHQAERVVLLTFLGAHRMHVNYPHQLARMEERVRYRLYLTARRRRLGVKIGRAHV